MLQLEDITCRGADELEQQRPQELRLDYVQHTERDSNRCPISHDEPCAHMRCGVWEHPASDAADASAQFYRTHLDGVDEPAGIDISSNKPYDGRVAATVGSTRQGLAQVAHLLSMSVPISLALQSKASICRSLA